MEEVDYSARRRSSDALRLTHEPLGECEPTLQFARKSIRRRDADQANFLLVCEPRLRQPMRK